VFLHVAYLSVFPLCKTVSVKKMGGQLDKGMLHWQPAKCCIFQLFIIICYLANKVLLLLLLLICADKLYGNGSVSWLAFTRLSCRFQRRTARQKAQQLCGPVLLQALFLQLTCSKDHVSCTTAFSESTLVLEFVRIVPSGGLLDGSRGPVQESSPQLREAKYLWLSQQ